MPLGSPLHYPPVTQAPPTGIAATTAAGSLPADVAYGLAKCDRLLFVESYQPFCVAVAMGVPKL